MKILDLKQGTEAWQQARLGMITGTRLKSVMGSDSVQEGLIYELVAEDLSGQAEKFFVNDAMRWGVDHENEAVLNWEKTFGLDTDEVGFCLSEEFDYVGLSPDRLVKEYDVYRGAVEVKCPTTKTFIKYANNDEIPGEYLWQLVNYFLVVDTLEWLDFVVYDPRIKDKELRMVVRSVPRDLLQEDIDNAKERLVEFRAKWKEVYDKVKAYGI